MNSKKSLIYRGLFIILGTALLIVVIILLMNICLSKGIPRWLPLYPGMEILSYNRKLKENDYHIVLGSSNDDIETIEAFYVKKMVNKGWKQEDPLEGEMPKTTDGNEIRYLRFAQIGMLRYRFVLVTLTAKKDKTHLKLIAAIP